MFTRFIFDGSFGKWIFHYIDASTLRLFYFSNILGKFDENYLYLFNKMASD